MDQKKLRLWTRLTQWKQQQNNQKRERYPVIRRLILFV